MSLGEASCQPRGPERHPGRLDTVPWVGGSWGDSRPCGETGGPAQPGFAGSLGWRAAPTSPGAPKSGSYVQGVGFPGASSGRESTCQCGRPGSIPGLGRAPGEGNGSPLQCSRLGNPTDEEAGGL